LKKSIATLLVSTVICFSVQAEPAKHETVKELMQKSGAGNLSVQMMNQMLPAMKQMVPDAPEQFWLDVMAEVDPNEMENMIIPVYQKYLTEEEILAINAFYDTDVGKKLISVQPVILQESMLRGQQWGQALSLKIIEKYQAQAQAHSSMP